MKLLFNYKWYVLLFVSVVSVQIGCKKEDISPADQSTAFIKYYGHVVDQQAADLKRTSDGGYLLLGTTNSYSTTDGTDMFLVKADSLGNEMWSKTFGTPRVGSATYDEVGVKIVVLPEDAGYIISGNRTQKVNGSVEQTKIVLYQLDLEGGVVLGPKVLRNTGSEATYSERISDIKFHNDTILGVSSYILTGNTTNLFLGKPGGIKSTDTTDILTMRLNETFGSMWTQGVLPYGFDGNDYGTSVHVLPDGYVVIGTDQQHVKNGGMQNIRVVKYQTINGAIKNTKDYGGSTYDFTGGYSQVDRINERITIFANVNDGANVGNLMVMQLDYDFVKRTPTAAGSAFDGTYGFRFYGPGINFPDAGLYSYGNLTANDLAFITVNDGYIASFTNTRIGGLDSEIGILKLDKNLEIDEGWPYMFGYQDQTVIDGTLEQAGAVIPVVEKIAGTAQTKITGYTFTGTFGLGTNEMLGLVKINGRGTLEPK